jgi:hypothetical protein
MNARVRSWLGAWKIAAGGTFLEDGAVIHEQHAVGGVARETHLVAHHHHCHAALAQVAHHAEHRAHELRIERAGRLVEQHHARLERDRPRDRDALLLAAGKLAGRVAGAVGEAHARQRGAAQLVGFGARFSGHLAQRERDVAERRHVRVEVERLEHHADALARAVDVGARIEQVDAVDHDAARGRLLEPVEAAQQRRFPRARRPDHEHQLALGHQQGRRPSGHEGRRNAYGGRAPRLLAALQVMRSRIVARHAGTP